MSSGLQKIMPMSSVAIMFCALSMAYASVAALTIGTMIADGEGSAYRPNVSGSRLGARTIGSTPPTCATWMPCETVSYVGCPCWRSMCSEGSVDDGCRILWRMLIGVVESGSARGRYWSGAERIVRVTHPLIEALAHLRQCLGHCR